MRRTIQGQVIQAEKGFAIPGLEVDLYVYQANQPSPEEQTGQAEVLGSVITNSDGSFYLEWDDAEVALPLASRSKPLVLMAAVFTNKKKPRSTTHERIKLATTSPRKIARIIDSFVICIPATELKKAGVKAHEPVSATEQPRLSIEEEIEKRLKLRSEKRDSLRKGTKQEIKRRLDVRAKGKTFAKTVLGRGPESRRINTRLFVAPGDDAKEILEQSIANGLNNLHQRKPKGITLHKGSNLNQAMEEALEAAANSDGKLASDIAEEILETTRSEIKSTRLHELLSQCDSEKESKGVCDDLNSEADPDGIEEEASTSISATEQATGEFSEEYKAALDKVLQLIKARTDLAIGQRPDTTIIAEALKKEVPLGPADTEAYYDFSSLQVAWEDTWTAAIDSMTADEVAKLYESIVEVLDPEVVEELETEVQSIVPVNNTSNLELTVKAVTDHVNTANSTPGYEAPPELVTWVPQIYLAWSQLPTDTQDMLSALHSFHDEIDNLNFVLKPKKAEQSFLGIFNSVTTTPSVLYVELMSRIAMGVANSPWKKPKTFAKEWTISKATKLIKPYLIIDTDEETAGNNTTVGNDPEGLTIDTMPPSLGRAKKLIEGIKQRLSEPHQFDIFVPDSYNFGVLFNFRQRWQPLNYQVGNLVSSMPLAPGEKRSFTKKKTVKTTRAQKEIEKALSTQRNDSTTTGRAEADIVNKANNSMNFSTTASGGFNLSPFNFSGSVTAGGSYGTESANTKNNFREAVRTAAQEYTDERTLEITTESDITSENVEQGEISNPNNELTVTYLFYELQRRFEVSEKLHGITPVVMVAYDVPAPNEIDEDWLLAHAWILKRVMLDDSLLKGLSYLTETFTGDEVGVDILYKQWVSQMQIVADIRDNVSTLSTLRDQARNVLSDATSTVAAKDGLVENFYEVLYGLGPEEKDVIEARTETARLGLEWASADFDAASSRLQSASQALRQATDDYLSGLKKQLNRRTAIDQLRIHVKDNILYYMQAIWRHEHRDQRYFRLYDLDIKWPEPESLTYNVSAATSPIGTPNIFSYVPKAGDYILTTPPAKLGETRKLHQVADLDQLLGFRGNYGIFPLKESNALTEYMSQDFLDNYFGVVDTDPDGEIPSRCEALKLVECVWNKDDTTDNDRLELTRWLTDTLSAQKRISEEIIVPTGQLYIEALPGSTPLLEDFKLKHRAIDVKAAESDLDMQLLEALRRLARLSDNDLTDPDIDKQIRINGDTDNISVDTE